MTTIINTVDNICEGLYQTLFELSCGKHRDVKKAMKDPALKAAMLDDMVNFVSEINDWSDSESKERIEECCSQQDLKSLRTLFGYMSFLEKNYSPEQVLRHRVSPAGCYDYARIAADQLNEQSIPATPICLADINKPDKPKHGIVSYSSEGKEHFVDAKWHIVYDKPREICIEQDGRELFLHPDKPELRLVRYEKECKF